MQKFPSCFSSQPEDTTEYNESATKVIREIDNFRRSTFQFSRDNLNSKQKLLRACKFVENRVTQVIYETEKDEKRKEKWKPAKDLANLLRELEKELYKCAMFSTINFSQAEDHFKQAKRFRSYLNDVFAKSSLNLVVAPLNVTEGTIKQKIIDYEIELGEKVECFQKEDIFNNELFVLSEHVSNLITHRRFEGPPKKGDDIWWGHSPKLPKLLQEFEDAHKDCFASLDIELAKATKHLKYARQFKAIHQSLKDALGPNYKFEVRRAQAPANNNVPSNQVFTESPAHTTSSSIAINLPATLITIAQQSKHKIGINQVAPAPIFPVSSSITSTSMSLVTTATLHASATITPSMSMNALRIKQATAWVAGLHEQDEMKYQEMGK